MQERQVCNDDNHDEVRIDGDVDVCLSTYVYNHMILAIGHLYVCIFTVLVQVKSGGSSLFNWESIGCNSDFVC